MLDGPEPAAFSRPSLSNSNGPGEWRLSRLSWKLRWRSPARTGREVGVGASAKTPPTGDRRDQEVPEAEDRRLHAGGPAGARGGHRPAGHAGADGDRGDRAGRPE